MTRRRGQLNTCVIGLGCIALLACGQEPQPTGSASKAIIAESDLIAVDGDPVWKSMTPSASAQKIVVANSTAPADAFVGDTSNLGVGTVRTLYGDGWKTFTLRAIGDNAEIWVANDLSYCPGDPRPPHVTSTGTGPWRTTSTSRSSPG